MRRKVLSRLAACLSLLLFSVAAVVGQSEAAKASASKQKMSQDVFKNIQTLKGVSADELIPAMQFITYSLGVECSFCHVEGALDKDDKKPKLMARKMMQMMATINQNNFDGKQAITCFSCHRGSLHPIAIPIVADAGMHPMPPMEHDEDNVAANLPSPDQIVSKYAEAVGGASALAKLNSRELKGLMTVAGHSLPLEIIGKTGNKQLTIVHLPNGDNVTAYNGDSGWTSAPNRPVHDVPETEVASARVEADLRLPLDLKELFSELKTSPPEKIGDHEVDVITGINSGEVAAKLYFDHETGLLLRILRFAKSPLGPNPTQIDYADYRVQDGVNTPFQQTIARPNSRFAIQIEQAKYNVAVDDARFARPAMPPPAAKP